MKTCETCGQLTDCPDHKARCAGRWSLAPLTPAVHDEPLSAVAYAVVRAYEQAMKIRSVEADNDAFVELRRFDDGAATVVESEAPRVR